MATRRRRHFSHDPLAVVMRFVDSANRHDADAVASCVHREFESIQPIHPVRNFRGSAQLLNNWKTIFRTEPGFRLTVLRSAVEGDTVWVELHGAGDNAEVAGIFIMGVENGLIRWARVYSELIEPEPAPVIPEPLAVSVATEGDAEPADADDEGQAIAEEPAVPALRVVDDGETAGEEAEPIEVSDPPEVATAGAAAEPEAVPQGDHADEPPPAAAEVEIEAALEEVREAGAAVEAPEVESPVESEEPVPVAPEAATGLAESEGADQPDTATEEEAAVPQGDHADELPPTLAGEVVPQPFPVLPPQSGSGRPRGAGGWRRLLGKTRRGQP